MTTQYTTDKDGYHTMVGTLGVQYDLHGSAGFWVVYSQSSPLAVEFAIKRTHYGWEEGKRVETHNDRGMFIDDMPILAQGGVKWDGCSHYWFPKADGIHSCSRRELTAIGTLLGHIFDQCADIMGDQVLDGDIGEEPVYGSYND